MADDMKGKAEHLGGKIKKEIGEALGDREMEREGHLDQKKGRAEQDEARARERAEEARREKHNAEVEKDRQRNRDR
ncbi:MAG TPA: CsbD family protein [Longimicrobiales bacterium]|nr:CsbD family protein [Longimicrobiales bacterium]